jgi:hypothetical protein
MFSFWKNPVEKCTRSATSTEEKWRHDVFWSHRLQRRLLSGSSLHVPHCKPLWTYFLLCFLNSKTFVSSLIWLRNHYIRHFSDHWCSFHLLPVEKINYSIGDAPHVSTQMRHLIEACFILERAEMTLERPETLFVTFQTSPWVTVCLVTTMHGTDWLTIMIRPVLLVHVYVATIFNPVILFVANETNCTNFVRATFEIVDRIIRRRGLMCKKPGCARNMATWELF